MMQNDLNEIFRKFQERMDADSKAALINLALGKFDLPFGMVRVVSHNFIPEGKNIFIVNHNEIYCRDLSKADTNSLFVIFPVPLPENMEPPSLSRWADSCIQAYRKYSQVVSPISSLQPIASCFESEVLTPAITKEMERQALLWCIQ